RRSRSGEHRHREPPGGPWGLPALPCRVHSPLTGQRSPSSCPSDLLAPEFDDWPRPMARSQPPVHEPSSPPSIVSPPERPWRRLLTDYGPLVLMMGVIFVA